MSRQGIARKALRWLLSWSKLLSWSSWLWLSCDMAPQHMASFFAIVPGAGTETRRYAVVTQIVPTVAIPLQLACSCALASGCAWSSSVCIHSTMWRMVPTQLPGVGWLVVVAKVPKQTQPPVPPPPQPSGDGNGGATGVGGPNASPLASQRKPEQPLLTKIQLPSSPCIHSDAPVISLHGTHHRLRRPRTCSSECRQRRARHQSR